IAYALDVIDDVVGVFLKGVVHARFEIGLRAVVIDPQPAAHIHILKPGAGAFQFDVDAARFHHRALDLADIRDLAAQVEVKKLAPVSHSRGLELLERAYRFRHSESEFRTVPAGRLPSSRPAAGELDSQPDDGTQAQPFGMFQNQVEFRVLFDNGDD